MLIKLLKVLSFFAVMIVLFFSNSFYMVRGFSMYNTYDDGSIVFVNKFNEQFNRYDVVIVKLSDSFKGTIVKRVVGLPGETIIIKNGYFMVNGKYLLKDIVRGKMDYAGSATVEFTLVADEYFVLGDNRNNSEDSRYEWLGPVRKNMIVGKVE